MVRNNVASRKCKKCEGLGIKEVAGGQGFEPRQAESESAVLPLDDPPAQVDQVRSIDRKTGPDCQVELSRYLENLS